MVSFSSTGNAAESKYRLVYIDCPGSLQQCVDSETNNLYCSNSCDVPPSPSIDKGSSGNTEPVLTLLGPETVVVAYGVAYSACPTTGTPTGPCDQGATASDAEDGVLTYNVKVCPFDAPSQSLYSLVSMIDAKITRRCIFLTNGLIR